MKTREIIDAAKEKNPDVFARVATKDVAIILKSSLNVITEHIQNSDEGTVRISGLGRFQVKHIDKDINGKRIKKDVVRYVPQKVKARVE